MPAITDTQTKPPPLGLIPESQWQELRMWEIIDALQRYRDANVAYPLEWLQELTHRSAEVYQRLYLDTK